MRAAITDARLVPVSVNLAPPIRFWTLLGGAVYLPDEDAVLLPGVGAHALSPWVRVDRPRTITWTEEWWAPNPGGQRYITPRYGDERQAVIGNNGAAQSFPGNAWDAWSVAIAGNESNRLSQATWCRWAIPVTTFYGTPGSKVRAPQLIIRR